MIQIDGSDVYCALSIVLYSTGHWIGGTVALLIFALCVAGNFVAND